MKLERIKQRNISDFIEELNRASGSIVYDKEKLICCNVLEIVDKEEIVGYIGYDYYEEREICISYLIIKEKYRCMGYGSEALERIVNRLVSNGAKVIWGFVNVENSRGIKFYLRKYRLLDKTTFGLTRDVNNAMIQEDKEDNGTKYYEIEFYVDARYVNGKAQRKIL